MTHPAPRYFDCFTDQPGGGNTVAIISGAAELSTDAMQAAARDIGAPATCFIRRIEGNCVHARFFSPRSEYKMCGHAVIGLFTMLLQDRLIGLGSGLSLATPAGISPVYVESQAQKPPRIMLDLPIPNFRPPGAQPTEIMEVLKIPLEVISGQIPVQVATADFTHLLVPLMATEALTEITPRFDEITAFCRAISVESIALFSLPTGTVHNTYKIREFCPAIGVDESAAGGTTNASVSCYLAQQGALMRSAPNMARTRAEQGAEIGRPSVIRSEVRYDGARIVGVRTGGTAVETFRA